MYSAAQGGAAGASGGATKVRGHNLMTGERPACVTLLSLVRDAAARLPNGRFPKTLVFSPPPPPPPAASRVT